MPVIFTAHPDLDAALIENWGIEPITVEFHTAINATPVDGEMPESIKSRFPFLKRAASEVAVQTLCVPCTSVDEVRMNSFDSRPKLHQNHLPFRMAFFTSSPTKRSSLVDDHPRRFREQALAGPGHAGHAAAKKRRRCGGTEDEPTSKKLMQARSQNLLVVRPFENSSLTL